MYALDDEKIITINARLNNTILYFKEAKQIFLKDRRINITTYVSLIWQYVLLVCVRYTYVHVKLISDVDALYMDEHSICIHIVSIKIIYYTFFSIYNIR